MTFVPDVVPSRGRLAVYDPSGASGTRALAGAAARLGLPADRQVEIRVAVGGPDGVEIRSRPATAASLSAGLPALLRTPLARGPSWRRGPDSRTCWSVAARLARDLVARQRIAPSLAVDGDGDVLGVWRALPDGDPVAVSVAALAEAMPPAAHALARGERSVWSARALVGAFLDAVADVLARAGPAAGGARPRARVLPWTARWLEALVDSEDPRVPLGEDAAELVAGVGAWLRPDPPTGGAALWLRVRAPDGGQEPWRLELGVRGSDGRRVPASAVWGLSGHARLRRALLRGLEQAVRLFPPLGAVMAQAAPTSVDLDVDAAWSLVREGAGLLEAAGVLVELPDGLAERQRLHRRLAVGVGPAPTGSGDGADPPVAAGMTRFRWELALGDDIVAPEELAALAAARTPLVRWRGRWARVDHDDDRLRDVGSTGQLPLSEALALALGGAGSRRDGAAEEVRAEGDVAALVEGVRDAGRGPPPPTTPPGFVGRLRPYQRRGVAWLQGMGQLGLGGVLADEMGLGKTVELIAHLLARPGPFLIVCPTSVVGNWQRELRRFAPGVAVARYHGADRPASLDGVDGAVLTTYAMVRRELSVLGGVQWDVVALDEAQHVKNPATAGARAVRGLRARQVVAMTGTPLENRLWDLWSIMDAANPGLLGARAGFGQRFVTPIERHGDAGAARRLRRVVAPFLLRREKGDPEVAVDLPERIDRTVSCALTVEQAALYRAVVDEVLPRGALREVDGMHRRGRVLALLTALKQVCNHPAQYLKEPRGAPLAGRSGKLAAARDIVGEVADAGDRVLVFTQYVAMGRLLVAQLSADLGAPVGLLHGGVAPPARDRMVAAFQGETEEVSPPVLVVSLRAGGTGLNLTAASHVVHYDRWWNPAVEDQATDRAHRIGQTRPVQVHKLVTAGTVEERVARLLERKRALAGSVVGAGETWLSELDDAELAELVALSGDATVAELDDDDPEAGGGAHALETVG
ncbi:MAG: DEAD/DEAH box helicase [Actinobacteria bacterium]|nr:DEAD/DEAH box helicase [Actinomycetota bacterium]